MLALVLGGFACGGGSGGGGAGGDAVNIEGTLSSAAATARVLGAGEGGIAGVQVSALGDTTTTDANGNFNLFADGNAFAGGAVEFNFVGDGISSTVILEGVAGGPGANAFVNFILEDSGQITGESTDVDGNVLGTTPGARLGCSSTGTFIDGALGALWKPHSERTGTVVVLMPPQYQGATFEVLNSRGEFVDGALIRDCCSHNGGREHIYLTRTAESLSGAGVPLTVRFGFPDGFVDCRVVDVPTQRYD